MENLSQMVQKRGQKCHSKGKKTIKNVYEDYNQSKKIELVEKCEKYKKVPNGTQNGTKNNETIFEYNCLICDYYTSNKKDFLKHCVRKKHKNRWGNPNLNENYFYECDKCNFIDAHNYLHKCNIKKYVCNMCNRIYKFRTGLMRHQKTCAENIKSDKLIKLLVETNENNQKLCEDNHKLCEKIISLENQPITQNTIINQEFNINLYLNVEYKDAMNITEFIDQLHLTVDDLLYSKEHGYIKGITNIFTKKLEDIDPSERPIHSIAEDKKQIHFYIKDGPEWECDTQGIKINHTINSVAEKQISAIKEWELAHPLWNTTEQGVQDYVKMVETIMGGNSPQEREQNIKQIKQCLIKNITPLCIT